MLKITFITYHIVILYAVVEALYQHRSTVLSCFMLQLLRRSNSEYFPRTVSGTYPCMLPEGLPENMLLSQYRILKGVL